MARTTNKGPKKEGNSDRVAGYSTKLYSDTVKKIKSLTKAGKVLYGDDYSERQLLEDALDFYISNNQDHYLAAVKMQETEEAIKNMQIPNGSY